MFIHLNDFDKKKLEFDKPGQYVVFFQNISGEIQFHVNAKNVQLYIFGLYQGNKKNMFSLTTLQIHKAPNSFSRLFVKSVMNGHSSFVYNGLIRIEKQAVQTHAYQKNMNMLVSKDAHVISEPFLEILTNDVFCSHASTTGPLDAGVLYYLHTRGYNLEEAKKLLIQGFINDIFLQIYNLEPEYNKTKGRDYQ